MVAMVIWEGRGLTSRLASTSCESVGASQSRGTPSCPAATASANTALHHKEQRRLVALHAEQVVAARGADGLLLSLWQPAESIVTIAPARSRVSSSWGMAATSLEPSSTATRPSVSRPWVAQALKVGRQPVAVAFLARQHQAGCLAGAGHLPAEAASQCPGASRAKTRANVSGLGTPLGSTRNPGQRTAPW